jgi:autotransporter-associated beta strand protein
VDDGRNATFSGQVSDEGAGGNLIKDSAGALTLAGSGNSIGGSLTVSAGSLTVAGSGMTVGTANFPGPTVNVINSLTVNTSAQLGGLGVSSDTPFILKGSDVVNPTYESHRTLTVQGGAMTVSGTPIDLSTTNIVATADTALVLPVATKLGNVSLKGGSLSADQDITMAADFIYQWELDSTAHSVAITGSLAFESTAWDLAIVDTGGTPLPGVKYDLFSYTGGVSGYSAPEIIALPAGWLEPSFTQDGTHIYMMFGLMGDANGDLVVDAADYIIVKQNFGMPGAVWADGDFDMSGTVDWDDLQILMANFGAGSLSAPATNTPEPATLGLLAFGALALLRRRLRTA